MSNHVIPSRIITALRDLIHELVTANYMALEKDGRAGRLSAQEIQQSIQNYGYRLVEPPEESFTSNVLSFLPLQGEISKWAVDISLWTEEEGRSDLTLQVTVEVTAFNVLMEIDDLGVM